LKRKGLIILGMLLICSILIFFSKGLQKSAVEELNTNSSPETQKIEDTSIIKENSNEKVSEEIGEKDDTSSTVEPSITKEDPKSSAENSSSTVVEKKDTTVETSKESTTPAKEVKPAKPTEKAPNFLIIDTINSKTIYSSNLNYDSKKTLYEHTNEALTVAKIKKIIKSNGYVAMIDNLFDYPSMPDKTGKGDWASCGWIYYINGNKATIGAKDYIPKETDIITWKYWKDAIYEK
jgi:hypothetical protein